MHDGDYRLVYPGTDVTFGSPIRPVYTATGPDLGDYEIRVSDAARPNADGTAFGSDYFGTRNIVFDLWVTGQTETDLRINMNTMASAWRADAVRSTPGAVAALYMRNRGLERVVFGRPRKFAPTLNRARSSVYGSIDAEFLCADNRFYSAETHQVSLPFAAATGGGLIAPLASPLATTLNSDRSIVMNVDSDLPVWPVVTVTGPITNPVVEIVGLWSMKLNLTLTEDQTLTIDTNPWVRSIFVNGASVAGTIDRNSVRLSAASIPPGRHELALRGLTATGTAGATITWRNCFSTP